jgi:hypothetical protein
MKLEFVPKLVLSSVAFALAFAASSCCCLDDEDDDGGGNGGGQVCVDFEDPASGTVFHVGDTFVDNGVTVSVNAFQWSNGTMTSNGSATIDPNNHALGSGRAGHANNINFGFGFGPASTITLKVGELGGNNNIRLNNEFRSFGNFVDVDNATIGGCACDFTQTNASGNNYYGTLTITGSIATFELGGQELWIDDVCATPGN